MGLTAHILLIYFSLQATLHVTLIKYFGGGDSYDREVNVQMVKSLGSNFK